jgi:hypothetical protein
VPSYIVVNSNDAGDAGRGISPAEGPRELKAILAHEIAHVLQFAMDRTGAACADYEWLDEATAEWAMDHVDPTWNREDGANRPSPLPAQRLVLRAVPVQRPHGRRSRSRPGRQAAEERLCRLHLLPVPGAQVRRADDQGGVRREPDQASVEAVEAALAPRAACRRSGRSSR